MTDKENLVLTAVGPDRIGLVEQISEFIVRHRCNIEDSKMAVFCGEFALILLLSGAPQSLQKIADAQREIESQTGLTLWFKTPASKKPGESFLPYRLTAACMDHPGVVYKLSRALSTLEINIESMETKTYAAPVSGTPIFRLDALISVPSKLNINDLRVRLDGIQREENIDIELSLVSDPSKSI
jgi:glycine cleavage system transcriptional repressor